MDTFDDARGPRSGAPTERVWADAADHDQQLDARPIRSILSQRGRGWAAHANLIVNPAGDAVFDDHARRLAVLSDDATGLQARLRHHYPDAVVRRRELSGETFEMWYVYRDGRWSPAER